MKIIKRPRQSGKTTMLLTYMEIVPESILFVYKEDYIKSLLNKVKQLGFNIDKSRFKSIAEFHRTNTIPNQILVDDLDCICERVPELGYDIAGQADIVTISTDR